MQMYYKQRRNESRKLDDIPWYLTLVKTGLIRTTCLIVMAINRELKTSRWICITQLSTFYYVYQGGWIRDVDHRKA